MRILRIFIALTAAAALSAPLLAQQSDTAAQSAGASSAPHAGRAVTVRGTIESVDRETRTILIKDEEGRMSWLRAGPELPNFDRLAKGNKVTVRYSEAVLLSLGNIDAKPASQADTQSSPQAADGGQPALQGAQPTRVMGRISEIDTRHNRIRLQTANDEDVLMAVPDAHKLSGVHEGDEVVATYIEARALAVEPDDGSGTAEGTEPGIDSEPLRDDPDLEPRIQ